MFMLKCGIPLSYVLGGDNFHYLHAPTRNLITADCLLKRGKVAMPSLNAQLCLPNKIIMVDGSLDPDPWDQIPESIFETIVQVWTEEIRRRDTNMVS